MARFRPTQLYAPIKNGMNAPLLRINSGASSHRSGLNSLACTKLRSSEKKVNLCLVTNEK